MGNSAGKEQRPLSSPSSPTRVHGHNHDFSSEQTPAAGGRTETQLYSQRVGRGSRHDLSFLGIGSSSHADHAPEARRETKQERETRKLAKERELREKERVRSMKEEHIDGGFCVTQGVYTGAEDFNKAIVRHLMIERRMAPFWRGLNDFKEEWTEYQLVAAARGLPIPAADERPIEEEQPSSPEPQSSTPIMQNLMVPTSSPSQVYVSDASTNLSPSNASPSNPTFSLPPQGLSVIPQSLPSQSTSPFRPRSKTLTPLATSSKTPSPGEMVPREIHLPDNPYVNGLAIEAFLYKDAAECPICLIYYPPYLNKTRCCDQPLCSECFVQIKRPEPHPPEHERNDATSTGASPPSNSEVLVSEPANCPYCQQPEFGVTYDPPPFRRGLVYGNSMTNSLGNVASAMSSSSSLNSITSPALTASTTSRRRTTSISANAPTVITTDKIRPDWATKLTNARNHAARRAAAATALHTAAYLMSGNLNDSRGFSFTSRARFGRRGGETPGSGTATPPTGALNSSLSPFSTVMERHDAGSQDESNQGGGSNRRRSRMDDLEDMMMMEAIRLSLAAEEDRKKKEEKEAKKEAKKKEKAEKKAEKAAKKMYHAGGNSPASASGSTLSLTLSGIARRRGNSGGSAFPRESGGSTDKGKRVDRGSLAGTTEASGSLPTLDAGRPQPGNVLSSRHHLDNGASFADAVQLSPATTAPEKPSHLRQMSNASSPASSFIESAACSLRNDFRGSSSSLDSPNASGTHLVGGTPDRDIDAVGQVMEPPFSFRSLAEMIEFEEGKENKSSYVQYPHDNTKTEHNSRQQGEGSTNAYIFPKNTMDESTSTLKTDLPRNVDGIADGFADTYLTKLPTPEVTVTPVTSAAIGSRDEANHSGDNFRYEL